MKPSIEVLVNLNRGLDFLVGPNLRIARTCDESLLSIALGNPTHFMVDQHCAGLL